MVNVCFWNVLEQKYREKTFLQYVIEYEGEYSSACINLWVPTKIKAAKIFWVGEETMIFMTILQHVRVYSFH
jgi:hypothetical protein